MVKMATAAVLGEEGAAEEHIVLVQGSGGWEEDEGEDDEEEDGPAGKEEAMSKANTVSRRTACVCSIGVTSQPRINNCPDN